MRILITRPEEDAQRLAELLRARGHEPILSPLMEIRFLDGPKILLDGVQANLVTSANGIRALARRTRRREIPVFAVGPQTAAAARDAGFIVVKDAQGDALALADAVPKWAAASGGVLVHVAGRERTGDLAGRLSQAGFQVRTEILYEAVPAESLSTAAIDAIRSGKLDAFMLFSPRSARTFVRCVAQAHLKTSCRKLVALCISDPTADATAPLAFAQTRVAKRPNLDAMLSLLDDARTNTTDRVPASR